MRSMMRMGMRRSMKRLGHEEELEEETQEACRRFKALFGMWWALSPQDQDSNTVLLASNTGLCPCDPGFASTTRSSSPLSLVFSSPSPSSASSSSDSSSAAIRSSPSSLVSWPTSSCLAISTFSPVAHSRLGLIKTTIRSQNLWAASWSATLFPSVFFSIIFQSHHRKHPPRFC